MCVVPESRMGSDTTTGPGIDGLGGHVQAHVGRAAGISQSNKNKQKTHARAHACERA